MRVNFVSHLPAAATIALLVEGTIVWLSDSASSLPSIHDLNIVLAACLLICGALSVAWAEKNLYSELAYQYSTMKSLFENADRQMACRLEALSQQVSQTDRVEFDRQLKEMQEMIFHLGLEALDENAEWLILHRARPLEPVMAG